MSRSDLLCDDSYTVRQIVNQALYRKINYSTIIVTSSQWPINTFQKVARLFSVYKRLHSNQKSMMSAGINFMLAFSVIIINPSNCCVIPWFGHWWSRVGSKDVNFARRRWKMEEIVLGILRVARRGDNSMQALQNRNTGISSWVTQQLWRHTSMH